MKKLLFALVLCSTSMLAQTTCVNCGGGVSGATQNVLQKGSATGSVADSSITDNGTNVTFTEPIIIPSSVAAAQIAIAGSTTSGLAMDHAASGPRLVVIEAGARKGLAFDASAGSLIFSSGVGIGWNSSASDPLGTGQDTVLARVAAASLRQGGSNSASPIAQTFTLGESSRGGTDTNVAGASGTVKPGIGTGTGAGTKFCIQRNLMGATGSVAQSTIDGYCVGPSKTLSNTSATAQSLVNISVPSNSAGGVEGTITVTCTDGTNFDAETQSFNTSFVNKATVLTVTSPVITATTAANNSGSCTAGITAVAGTNSVDIKVTPVFTTIVPTTVTSYIALRNNGTGNATFN